MRLWNTIMGFLNKLKKDSVDAYACQAAFFIILSVIPFLMLVLSAIKYIPVTEAVFERIIEEFIPGSMQAFVSGILNEINSKSPALMSVTAVVSVWLSARGLQSLTAGLNSVYEIQENRPWIVLRLRAAFHTILMLAALIVLMLLVVFGNRLEAVLAARIPFLGRIMEMFVSKRIIITSILLIVVFDIFFVALPNRKATFLSQLPGAVVGAVVWIGFSFAFSIYVDISDTVSMYGSLTTIVLIMMWLYFLMYILLACGAINLYFNEFFRKTRERIRAKRILKKQLRLEEKQKNTNKTID